MRISNNFKNMEASNLELLHEEHNIWYSEIKFFQTEIRFLNKVLKNINTPDLPEDLNLKLDKYINHLDHNARFLKSTMETINSHELFLKDMIILNKNQEGEEEDIQDIDEDEFTNYGIMDHDKTRAHLADFRKRYNKLKLKIFKLSEKALLQKVI